MDNQNNISKVLLQVLQVHPTSSTAEIANNDEDSAFISDDLKQAILTAAESFSNPDSSDGQHNSARPLHRSNTQLIKPLHLSSHVAETPNLDGQKDLSNKSSSSPPGRSSLSGSLDPHRASTGEVGDLLPISSDHPQPQNLLIRPTQNEVKGTITNQSLLDLNQKRILSPTQCSNSRNVRPRVETAEASEATEEPHTAPSHPRFLSTVATPTTAGSDLTSQSDSGQAEPTLPDKKPLSASTALPVYSKLIAALEEARLSDCLTPPMSAALAVLTDRCKKTGNAIIQRLPLPPEDAIIILDDDDEDLVNKYGDSLHLFECTELNLDTQQIFRLARSPSEDMLEITMKQGELTNAQVFQETTENADDSQIDISGQHQKPKSRDMAATESSPPQLQTSLDHSPSEQHNLQNETEDLDHSPFQSRQSELAYNLDSTELQPSSKQLTSLPKSTQTLPHLSEGTASPDETEDLDRSPVPSRQSELAHNPVSAELQPPIKHLTALSKSTESKPHSSEGTASPDETEDLERSPLQPPIRQLTALSKSTESESHLSERTAAPDPDLQDKPIPRRDLRTWKKANFPVVIPKVADSCRTPKAATVAAPRNVKKRTGSANFFLGTPAMEKELVELLSPYNSHQTTKRAKLIAWEALNSLLERRRLGEPLDQTFLNSIDGRTNNVEIRTQFNAQTWFNAIERKMPWLFNSHPGEPAYALGFFNTSAVMNDSPAGKVPAGVPAVWHPTWRSMRMTLRPSPVRVSSFLKILLDSVLLTGKVFLKEPPVSEQEKAMTGVQAVCQAIKWLNSQKPAKSDSKRIRLLDSDNLNSMIDLGLIQQWQDVFMKVLDSYVVQRFEAHYILNEEASKDDKAVAMRFKKEWKGDSIKTPTLGYLTMFACCGIRGLICCSNDVNITPAGQMLSFAVLSEWLCKRRPGFEVKDPIFKRSNQMLMKLIDGLFDKEGHFVKPEITWYDVARNLCFDYLSYWFLEAGDLVEGDSLVFPKSSAFSGKEQTIRFPAIS
ncbi:hypothetical protein DFH28DRAFT_890394 [Melampsora americana]|nr:hypothetical protein DFH28DRAFT_890394 [Melampsora americana]